MQRGSPFLLRGPLPFGCVDRDLLPFGCDLEVRPSEESQFTRLASVFTLEFSGLVRSLKSRLDGVEILNDLLLGPVYQTAHCTSDEKVVSLAIVANELEVDVYLIVNLDASLLVDLSSLATHSSGVLLVVGEGRRSDVIKFRSEKVHRAKRIDLVVLGEELPDRARMAPIRLEDDGLDSVVALANLLDGEVRGEDTVLGQIINVELALRLPALESCELGHLT